ncbi:hypothetical protein K3172_05105 [Qipengyuania sp. 6B39]|uniref:hypothetical protein n=1 Tax=Qipengyuania proteolytica TaxID=2867239 RepID=UPI001C8B09DC|nr:hypothetical protein [Qipengyuania proteolytica]MBX7495229.1 hypothetical protein [Qipengyuania proteolytica]
MSFWTAIVLIVAISTISGVFIERYKAMGRIGQQSRTPRQEHDLSAAERHEINDLRERIKVLERIATDGNSLDAQETKRIAAEIDALRDKQAD